MADQNTGQSDDGTDESHKERVDRELIELLNELRVALPGVQVLFAFLLTVPFATGFEQTTDLQRNLYFAVTTATALSAALLIAPSAWHRLLFRESEKEKVLQASNKMAIAGLGLLALAMTGAVVLIADFVFSSALAIAAGVIGLLAFSILWYAMPLRHRLSE